MKRIHIEVGVPHLESGNGNCGEGQTQTACHHQDPGEEVKVRDVDIIACAVPLDVQLRSIIENASREQMTQEGESQVGARLYLGEVTPPISLKLCDFPKNRVSGSM